MYTGPLLWPQKLHKDLDSYDRRWYIIYVFITYVCSIYLFVLLITNVTND